MRKLNCKTGDLAIIVRAELPQNLGRIVHIIKPLGVRPSSEFGNVHMWWVESLPGSSYLLHYLYPNGRIEKKRQGSAPDMLLRPIVPPDRFTQVSDWLKTECERPADIARGVAMWCDYEDALRGKR